MKKSPFFAANEHINRISVAKRPNVNVNCVAGDAWNRVKYLRHLTGFCAGRRITPICKENLTIAAWIIFRLRNLVFYRDILTYNAKIRGGGVKKPVPPPLKKFFRLPFSRIQNFTNLM